jgi:hypothetical protein
MPDFAMADSAMAGEILDGQLPETNCKRKPGKEHLSVPKPIPNQTTHNTACAAEEERRLRDRGRAALQRRVQRAQ